MKVKLGDICNINMGQSPDSSTYNKENDGLPFFQGNADFGEIHPIAKTWCSKPLKIADKNDILISVRAPIGALNIAKEKSCIGRGLAAIKADETICLQKYLKYILESKKDILVSKGTGSTFKAISKNTLAELEFTIPSLKTQHQHIEILDKLINIINLQKTQYQALDLMVKSRFIEMFGTYPANEKSWQTGTIRDVITEARYGSSRPAVDGGKYPYLRMNNITYDGRLALADIKTIDVPDSELPKCSVKYGDVLFNRTNSRELVGKTCVYTSHNLMVLAGFIIRIRVKDIILPEFLSAFLNTDFSKNMLRNMCKSAIGQANINAQEMQNIGIYIPPIEKQQEFVRFERAINDKSKFTS